MMGKGHREFTPDVSADARRKRRGRQSRNATRASSSRQSQRVHGT